MPEWRMLVWQPDGTARATINVDGPVARLDRFDVNGAGNCLEASWTADPQAVTIKARDVVRLDAREAATDAWTSVYKGFVTIAGSSRAESLQDYRAVGLKQRFYEILLEEPFLTGADVATMVDEALTSITLPTGVAYSSTDVPTLDFQLGTRYPRGETLGDTLDELVATVGPFVVPTGETYTYDGKTYGEGDIVPAVRWGVKADGSFFFTRPQASAVSVSEGDIGVRVRWERATGEEAYDRVALIYASEYEPWSTVYQRSDAVPTIVNADDIVGHPIMALFGSGSPYGSTTRVPLTNPIDYMTDEASNHSQTSASITNPLNAFDGDPSTYAEFPNDDSSAQVASAVSTSNNGTAGVVVRVVFEKTDEADPLNVILWFTDGTFVLAELKYSYADADTKKRTVILPALVPAAITADGIVEVRVKVGTITSKGAKLYALEMYTPDTTLGEKVHRVHLRSVDDKASEVELIGQLGGVSQTMTLTPNGEAAEDVNIERIEYALSPERGLVTRYSLAQSFEAELLSQRIVLERLIRSSQT